MGGKNTKQDNQDEQEPEFPISALLDDPGTFRIGKGTEGSVYSNNEAQHLAFKRSHLRSVQDKWDMEFGMQREVCELLSDYPKVTEYIDVPNVFSHEQHERHSYIIMERVQPCWNVSQKFGGQAVHAYLTENEYCSDLSCVGLAVGRKIVERIVDIEETIKALGKFLALLHYRLNFDAHDVEYILGTTVGSDKVKLYAIDFGKMSRAKRHRDLEYGFSGYIPHTDKTFIKHYVREAERVGKGKSALHLLDRLSTPPMPITVPDSDLSHFAVDVKQDDQDKQHNSIEVSVNS